MIGILDTMPLSLTLYLLLCIISVLTGYGLLRLLKLEVLSISTLLLAPVLTLVIWSVALGMTGGLGFPTKQIAPWLWGVTILLAINGRRWCWSIMRAAGPILMLCAVLPVVIMAPYFWHGLSDYIGSITPDGWSYMAYGQYIWEYQRGTQGGLAPLYQYAAHLSGTRYISPAILGFFSPLVRTGDTQAVSALFQAWTLFSMTCAVALFWVAAKQRAWMVMTATVLSTVAGWIANLIWANNFDNGLALVYMPACAGVMQLCSARNWRWWLIIGTMLAAAWYSYIELVPFVISGAVLITLPRFWQERRDWSVWLWGSGMACAFAIVLLLPITNTLVAFFYGQFNATRASKARPGEGMFRGLTIPQFQPAAFWGLGGEHQIQSARRPRNALGVGLSILAVLGLAALIRKQQGGLAALAVLLTLGAIYLIIWEHYSYGAYKLIVVNWWCLIATLVAGAEWVIAQATSLGLRRSAVTVLGCLVLLLLFQSRHTDAASTSQYIDNPNRRLSMAQFRQVLAVKDHIGSSPLLIGVDDWLANEWAVYYLRGIPILLTAYHMYMGQTHVVPFMKRAATVDLSTIRYVLTAADPYSWSVYVQGWQKQWASDPYILWQIPRQEWVMVARIDNHNGIEQLDGELFFWIGQGDTTIEVLASREGIMHLMGTFLLGPSVPEKTTRMLLVATDTGYRATLSLGGGANLIAVPTRVGSTQIILRPLDQPIHTAQSNGDTRPLVLGVRGLKISLEGYATAQ